MTGAQKSKAYPFLRACMVSSGNVGRAIAV